MSDKPKISIITPSYNQGQFIEQTIDSVLSQGYDNLEYIVIDGGSKDETTEILNKYSKYISYWISEPDTGQSNAINKGVKIATGDVVNWLNSDDYYEPNCLKQIGEIFENPSNNIACGRSNLFKGKSILKQSNGTDVYSGNLEKTIAHARIDQPETFFRKLCWDKIGLINEDLHYIMDRDLWVRYLIEFSLTGIVKTDNIWVNFRLHENSKTVSESNLFNIERNNYFTDLINRKIIDQEQIGMIKSIHENSVDWNKVKSYFYLLLLEEAYWKRDRSSFKKFLKEINISHLETLDAQNFKKLNCKSRIIPLIKLIKKGGYEKL